MLQFRNACKRNIESVQISIESWESATADCNNWRQAVWRGIRKTEEKRTKLWMEKRVRGPINPSLIVISSLTHVSRMVLPYLIHESNNSDKYSIISHTGHI